MVLKRSGPRSLMALLASLVIIGAGCSAAVPSSSPSATAGATPAPAASLVNITPEPIAAGPGPNGGVVVRWFIGLGAGTQPAQITPEQAFATA
ncbi:MAG: hypothetical protein QOI09_1580, partial [Chloroflexota bacterium]|nr:hypothetical protein [Chloroflexota bacterium]